MAISRKHFRAIAEVVATIEDNPTRWRVASRLATILAETNSQFDSAKFRRACDNREEQIND